MQRLQSLLLLFVCCGNDSSWGSKRRRARDHNVHGWIIVPSSLSRVSTTTTRTRSWIVTLQATKDQASRPQKGFGAVKSGSAAASAVSSSEKSKTKDSKRRRQLGDVLKDDDNDTSNDASTSGMTASGKNMPFVKSKQEDALAELAAQSSTTVIGRAVTAASLQVAQHDPLAQVDPFWELMPSLISSKFPKVRDASLERIAGFVRHAILQSTSSSSSLLKTPTPDDWLDQVDATYRPFDDVHTYIPNLPSTQPFYNASQFAFCQLLQQNYATICAEYHALLEHMQTVNKHNAVVRFQSVTSMNYESGWQTLILFYNGHRIPNFPYHLCPVTTRLLEQHVPLAGRIAGFNRQAPSTGIPRHTDGNNLWLTCQMGIVLPTRAANTPTSETEVATSPADETATTESAHSQHTQDFASITVGSETRYWQPGGHCLVYDTTYEHETFNRHETMERVVLHVDFFNTVALTTTEIDILQYIYSLREQFMKAEGVAKVGAHIL